ncbi:MAG: hypothetical protein R3B06_01070 [Kofleriaceae bacterium]
MRSATLAAPAPASADDDDEIVPVRRRYRLFAVPSGALLFLCMFLPFVQVCDAPVYPYQAPLTCLPYLVAAIAVVRAVLSPPVRRTGLRRARALAMVAASFWTLATAWFALFACSGDGLIGSSLAASASAWMVVAAICRYRDLGAADRSRGRGARLPVARVGRVDAQRPIGNGVMVALMAISFAAGAGTCPAQRDVRPVDVGERPPINRC